jgi:hypothetical protein
MRAGVFRCAVAIAAALIATTYTFSAQSAPDCEQAGRIAEAKFGVPPGLLLAIGHVEAGRRDPNHSRVVAWPWSVDVEGQGHQFNEAAGAIDMARSALASGHRNIDVGCFQISLLYHGHAFPTLETAFDPAANSDYAAAFLSSLRNRLGSWEQAVAAYHSATPDIGEPYRRRVFNAWDGTGPSNEKFADLSAQETIHVWFPTTSNSKPEVISLTSRDPSALRFPRVITPETPWPSPDQGTDREKLRP